MKFSQPVFLFNLSLLAALSLLSASSTIALALPVSSEKTSSALSSTSSARGHPIPTRSSSSSYSSVSPLPLPKSSTKKKTAGKKTPSTSSLPPPSKLSTEPPLLLLPDSTSIWHAGSVESVRWSKKYAKKLPKDTTVDIILVDSKTNKKVYSLKRFIPFRKGAAQVWVPSKIPEDATYILVLELFHGRSQTPAMTVETKALSGSTLSTTAIATSTKTTATPTQAIATKTNSPDINHTSNGNGNGSNSNRGIPSILRRSDISIARRAHKVARGAMTSSSSSSSSTASSSSSAANKAVEESGTGDGGSLAHHDIHDDDYYKGHRETQPLEFLPEEFRQEYPNIVQPIDLEHTFGLHQKVYTMAPYTLEWKVPARVAELLEYTQQRLRLMADKTIDLSRYHTLKSNNKTFLAKILVELVQDHTLESVSVLARNVPAETKFQYLQIHEKVPQAFYRLRVQMAVVEVEVDSGQGPEAVTGIGAGTGDATSRGTRLSHGDYMEGWDFPSGGQVIDRYESITRRFWVSEGAL